MASEATRLEVARLIEIAITRVQALVKGSEKVDSRTVIERYTAAFAVHFTDWLGKTLLFVRHPRARCAVAENLRCETRECHVQMLRRFAGGCGAMPDRGDYAYVQNAVDEVDGLFVMRPHEEGLRGLALCTVLECTSEIFIPDLTRRTMGLGCTTDLTYTTVHGVADVEHSLAFREALVLEFEEGYDRPYSAVESAVDVAVALLERIYKGP